MKQAIVFILVVLVCSFSGGCANLMLKEKERALYESYEKGKINKVEYLSQKSLLQREEEAS